jgi:Ca2+-binding EF-hand superfamily protein
VEREWIDPNCRPPRVDLPLTPPPPRFGPSLSPSQLLEEKIRCRYRSVQRAFVRWDQDCDGEISDTEFRTARESVLSARAPEQIKHAFFRRPSSSLAILVPPPSPPHAVRNMGLDMTSKEYQKLWKRFDSSGDGKISYAEVRKREDGGRRDSRDSPPHPASPELDFNLRTHAPLTLPPLPPPPSPNQFNNKVGGLIHPKSDLVLKRPETPKMKEWQARAFARGLKKKLANIEGAFREVDSDGSGLISHQEFIQLLRRLDVKMNSDDSFSMMNKYRSAGNDTGEMTFDEFKTCLMDYMKIPVNIEDIPDDGPKPMPLAEAEKIIADKLFNKFSAVQKAFRLYDEDHSGELSYDELRRMFRTLNVNLTNDQFISLVKKFDPDGDGSISYEEYNRQLGPLIHPSAQDSSRSMKELLVRGNAQDSLVFNPTKLNAKEKEEVDILGGSAVGGEAGEGDEGAADPAPASGSDGDEVSSVAGKPRSSVAPVAAVRSSDYAAAEAPRLRRANSVATSQWDVDATEEKMRRVLGKSWVQVYRDVRKTEGVDASQVAPEAFRDMMAEKGIPLTSKEVRALSLRYGAGAGAGAGAGGAGAPAINVDRLLKDTFKGPLHPSHGQGLGGTAAVAAASVRPGSAVQRGGPVSPTRRPATAAATARSGGANAMSGKPVF